MDSKTKNAVMWLMEGARPGEPKRTAVEAAKRFGLNQPNGISVALRAYRSKKREEGLQDLQDACQALYDHFISSGGDPNSIIGVQVRTALANME